LARQLSRREFLAGAAGLGAAAVLGACAPGAPAPQPGPAELKPSYGGTVIYGTFADAQVLNPILSTDVPSSEIIARVFDSVVDIDPNNGQPIPNLAERWQISSDGLTYTFYFNKNVKWHDGKPFTAHDVKFTIEAILDPKTQTVRKNLFELVKGAKDRIAGKAAETEGVKVVDDYTLQITLTETYCPFLVSSMSFLRPLPRHLLEGKDINTDEFNRRPVGTGPFKFKEWVKDDHITLVRNENWWKRSGGPYIDEFIRKVVKDATVVVAQLKTGEVDIGGIEPKDLAEIQREAHLDVRKYLGLGYTYIGYNLARPPLDDRRVRLALTHAVDMKSVVEKVLLGEGVQMAGHMPPASWAYNPNIKPPEYNPQRARQLLEQAGFKPGPDGIMQRDGKPLKFTLYTNSGNKVREQVATIAKDQWKQIGVDVDIQFQEWNAFLDRLNKTRDFDMVIVGWSLGVDPGPAFKSIFHSGEIEGGFNFVSYRNPEVDRLIEEGLRVPGCDQEKRKQIYWRVQEIMAEDPPYNFGFAANTIIAVNRRVQGVNPTVFGGTFYNIHDWYVTK